MTSIQQRAELQRRIWQIANDVRGAVDGWDFKQYVLGTLFYRFISENFAAYIEGGDDSINYAELSDSVITPDIKDDAIKTKGYFIYPSQLFSKVAASANTNESLNTDLAAIFAAIEASANGYPSERDIKGLFADFDTTSNRLGNTVKDKNLRLAAVLKGVAELNFADFEGSNIDLFGDAYEFLISNYAANAGKSGGEFFTPQHVSKLIAQAHWQDRHRRDAVRLPTGRGEPIGGKLRSGDRRRVPPRWRGVVRRNIKTGQGQVCAGLDGNSDSSRWSATNHLHAVRANPIHSYQACRCASRSGSVAMFTIYADRLAVRCWHPGRVQASRKRQSQNGSHRQRGA